MHTYQQLSSYAVNLHNSIYIVVLSCHMNHCILYTNQLQWCGVFGERHKESHTAMRYMAIPVVCRKYTTVGGGARNHPYRGEIPRDGFLPLFL